MDTHAHICRGERTGWKVKLSEEKDIPTPLHLDSKNYCKEDWKCTTSKLC